MGEKTLVGLIGTAILFCTGIYFGYMNAEKIQTTFSYMKQQVKLKEQTPAQQIGESLLFGAKHYHTKYQRTMHTTHPLYMNPNQQRKLYPR
jgi:hypothetical protein